MKLGFACASWIFLCGSLAFAQAPKPGTVGFRGKSYEPAALPDEVGLAAKTAVRDWSTWAKTNGYRMDLDPSRRVLLLSTKSSVDAQLSLVVKTIALFDSLFPAALVPAPEPASTKPSAAPATDEIPEDPEAAPPGAPATLPADRNEKLDKEAPAFRPDSQTAVMLIAKSSADYAAALDQLIVSRAHLAEWKKTAAPQIGFVLEDPLCGAYNENSPGQEEWNPDNELVHRTMALLVLRRFSEQPYWLSTGLGWYAELAITKSIYCMPYRDGFVAVGEHGDWLAALNSMYSGRAKEPLRPQEFALTRGKWDDKLAKTALGVVDFMCKTNPRPMAGLLEELRHFRDQNGRKTNPDGSWTKLLDYEVPLDQQKLLLERYYGADVMRGLIAYWTTGATAPVK